MKIRWMPLAEKDLEAAYAYLSEESARAAARLVARVFEAAEMLVHFPSAGHAGRVAETRELSIPRTPYIVAYRQRRDEIQILSLIHGARKWPMSFSENE